MRTIISPENLTSKEKDQRNWSYAGRMGRKNDNKFKAWRRWLQEGRGQRQDLSFTVLWKIQLRFQKQLSTFNMCLSHHLGKWGTLSAKTVKAFSSPLWDCLTWLLLCHPLIPDFIPRVILACLKAFPQLLFFCICSYLMIIFLHHGKILFKLLALFNRKLATTD